MKKTVLILLALLLVLIASAALAEDDPLKVGMTLSNNKPAVGETIHVAITVTHTGERDLPGPVRLFGPDRKKIEEFGEQTIAPGQTASWEGDWTITKNEQKNAKITYSIRYNVYDDDNEVRTKTKNFSKKLAVSEAQETKSGNKGPEGLMDNWDGYSILGAMFPVKPGRAEERLSYGKWVHHEGTADIINEFFSDGSMTMTIVMDGKSVTYPGLYRIVDNNFEMYVVRDDGRIDTNTFEGGFDGYNLYIGGSAFGGE